MKKLPFILIISLLLSSCSSAIHQPSIIQTETAVFTKTFTLSPTVTKIPTATSTPSLPSTIEFQFDKEIPENFVQIVETTVNQAYWFYVSLGCSPEFHHVTVTARENAGGVVNGIVVGWDDLKNVSPNMDSRISHEMAHAMCQLAIKNDPDTSVELEWLLEGMANYFSDNERLINVGAVSAVPGNVLGHQKGMAEWVMNSNFCVYPFKAVEMDIPPLGNGAWALPYPEVGGVASVAAALLANTSSDGTQALINYYRYLRTEDSDTAFEKAFGKTKEDFYQQFTDECESNFPSLNTIAAPFDVMEILDPTVTPPADIVKIQGTIIISDGSDISGKYYIVPCKLRVDINFINIDKCVNGVSFNSNGSFIFDLAPGSYYFSINSRDGGDALGWYAEDGLVSEPTCAKIFKTSESQSISIKIDPKNIISC